MPNFQISTPENTYIILIFCRALGVIAQYLDADDKNDVVCLISLHTCKNTLIVIQKSFQALLPSMIQVIGQAVEVGNEAGARHLFDVLETLLILVCRR